MAFTHLHVHTEFSLLDGFCKIKELPGVVKSMGQTACAITDHGVMYGVIDFYRACKAEGIKPIIGCEVYVAPQGRTRFDKVHEFDSESRHLVLLCENEEGYRNLSYMVSLAWTEGFYVKPRIDQALLREHSKGLIALSACLAGEIPRRLRNGEYDNAKAYALEMAELFGPDRFYLELQDHGIRDQKIVNQSILKIHQETGIPMVCTNDAHYLRKEDAEAHDILLCIQTGKTVDDENRMRYEPQNFYLRSEEEMAALFAGYEDALENTQKITEMCNLEFTFGKYHLPEFKLPEGYDSFSYLKKLCDEGYKVRYGDDDKYRGQLKYEQDMIEKMGFTDYFLIVSDFVRYAKSVGIPVGPGRGSAAGSMVSYCLSITDIDPMKYSLYFERFLNPERVSMPDIDMDFGDTRRGEVVDYVRRKYGDDHVAQIVTFGTMAARGVIRDVGRVLNMPYADVDVIAKLVPNTLHITLNDALRLSKQLSDLYEADEQVKKLIDTARALEGMPRHASTHAAGVVITRKPVYEYVPLAKNDESVVCQYIMTTLEELGLLKMDFLGLRNLTVLDDAVKMVQTRQPDFTLDDIPEGDPETYKMLSDGKTNGVFQMESSGMTGVCVGLKPQSIEDITAIIALYRPGPMDSIPTYLHNRHEPDKISYKTPQLAHILDVTNGCIVYQEQVMQIFRELAGFSFGQADNVRRAMSKKKHAVMEAEREHFVHGCTEPGHECPGCVANGISEKVANEIYDEMSSFASYAFNKSHAACYAYVAFQTAYLKCHYPSEFMAALLTSVLDNTDKVIEYSGECARLGIKVLPPDVNVSGGGFTADENGQIRFGLNAVKNVGRNLIENVVRERRNKPYTSLYDFCKRMHGNELNRRAVECLIKAGAFDRLGNNRHSHVEAVEGILKSIETDTRRNLDGQLDLFSVMSGGEQDAAQEDRYEIRQLPEYSHTELLQQEKEVSGLYLSGHPLDAYREKSARIGSHTIKDLTGEDAHVTDGERVRVVCAVVKNRMMTTKSNSMMAFTSVEDLTGTMEVIVFPKVLDTFRDAIRENAVVVIDGRLSVREDEASKLLADSIVPIDSYDPTRPQNGRPDPVKAAAKRLYIRLPSRSCPQYAKVINLLGIFDGNMPVILYLEDTKQKLAAPRHLYTSGHPLFFEELERLVGAENIATK